MITSQAYSGTTDYRLAGWQEAGLIYPSWVRMKLATLSHHLIQFSPGRISESDAAEVEHRLRLVFGLAPV
jgi:hypothetical protein